MKILLPVEVIRKKIASGYWCICHICGKDIETIGEIYYESDFASESNLLPENTFICKECSQEGKK